MDVLSSRHRACYTIKMVFYVPLFFENYTIIKCGHGAGVEENYCHSNLFKLSSPIII